MTKIFLYRWGENVMVAGNDRKIVFYNDDGRVSQTFDYSGDHNIQDFSKAALSPSGQTAVFASFNR